jgi:hypothetical protein|tara:strand:- start:373 stop:615 length:243 start_codon:yes stop_codon:yes gene_type:complete
MKARIMKNTWTFIRPKGGWYGWVVVVEDDYGELYPIHPANCPFKTKKSAINAVKNGRFEKDGVTGISYAKLTVDKSYSIW